MKNFEIYIMNRYYREETQEFFSGSFRSYFLAENDVLFLLQKRDFNIFQFGKPAIRDLLGHEICR